MDELGYDANDITYDTFDIEFTSSGNVKRKVKSGKKTVRFAEPRDGSKGILPEILRDLLGARKKTRKMIPWKKIKKTDGKEISGDLEEKEDRYIIKNNSGT